jgi:hypothetical protein
VSANGGHDLSLVSMCGNAVRSETGCDSCNHAMSGFLIAVHVVIGNCDELDASRAVVARIGGNVSKEVFCLFEESVSCDSRDL